MSVDNKGLCRRGDDKATALVELIERQDLNALNTVTEPLKGPALVVVHPHAQQEAGARSLFRYRTDAPPLTTAISTIRGCSERSNIFTRLTL